MFSKKVDFKDEAYIIYVNSSIQDDTELGRLMHDFHCKDAKDVKSRILAERVYELKEMQGGVDSMCKEMEMLYTVILNPIIGNPMPG